MSARIVIVGAGGHGAVIADALLAAGEEVLGFTDVDSARHGRRVCGLPVLGDDTVLQAHTPQSLLLANGIGGTGNVAPRRAAQLQLQSGGWRFASVRHPTAIVSPFASMEGGVQLLAASIVQANTQIGTGCIVNTGAVVEHDVVLGAWTHVAPRAVICGDVVIGADSHIGAGAVIRQGVRLGARTIVGAGAVVVEDFAGGGVLVGVPARQVERRS